MKAVIQRVSSASVKVGGQIISKIDKGLVVLLGISSSDKQKDIEIIVDKINNLRIFEDSQGKMNVSIKEINGEILLVPQFTLLADLEKGRRPSFIDAAQPPEAENIYRRVADTFREGGIKIKLGRFGEHMLLELINYGPATFLFDTNKKVAQKIPGKMIYTFAATKPRHLWRGWSLAAQYSAQGTPGFSPGGLHFFLI